jgi:hypothetical protein
MLVAAQACFRARVLMAKVDIIDGEIEYNDIV